jgi:F0F1-type ATP synthase membrane subunit b/b'
MDIQHLVDRLEDLVDEGRHMPFSRFTLVDEEHALEIIDQMRISIPEEIEKAARVLAQRDRILAQANEEAARIVKQARDHGEQLLDQDSTVQLAQGRADEIVGMANQEAHNIVTEADNYALRAMSRLQQQLERMLSVVPDSVAEVQVAEQQATQPQPAQPPQPVQPPVQQPPKEMPSPFKPPRPMVDVGAEKDERRRK